MSPSVDLSVQLGSIRLPNPVMTASGTAGHGTELARFMDLSKLGAFVVKSLAAFRWEGNAAPRVHPADAAMINSVGLQGPGVEAWLDTQLPKLVDSGVERIVVSIWGRTNDDYRLAAEMLSAAPPEVIAVEVNLSCPNLDGGRHLFAHDPNLSAEVIRSAAAANRPLWAKLSPNTDRLSDVASAVHAAGAEAVTVANTLLGLVIDPATRRPVLGAGGGGLSGAAIRPVAVRAVYDCAASNPEVPIVGVGGIATAEHALEHILAGATAVQVGTATFADPRAPLQVLDGLERWCLENRVDRMADLCGGAHG